MPHIVCDVVRPGMLCYYGNAFTYCNPMRVAIALAIVIIVLPIIVWIGIRYTGGVVE